MVMSQGASTFLLCFSGFWLGWAVVVMLCCFCSFLQRRLKRRLDDRLQSVDTEPLSCSPPPLLAPPPPLQPPLQLRPAPPHTVSPPLPLQLPHPLPQATWVSLPDADVIGKPPCYEEAVLMADPPPPYSEILADPQGGTYQKPVLLRAAPPPLRENQNRAFESKTGKSPPTAVLFPDRGYSSLIRLPSSRRWDSLGRLLSNMDLNHNNLMMPTTAAMATMPRRELRAQHGGHGLRGGTQGGIQGFPGRFQGLQVCGLLGRSTAV
ncbi:hypothetical protein JOB18_021140 [Solea senegalensis]|uniref:Proline-rich protein 7 n=2 Tax=Solea senegalensis TaxID=28829 RepID=A0AAV6SGS0_SOLSE|nr:proline-rich protein 7 isoform X2 [Solea senegalensis]XP_043897931.1 proline-rich protein 7 isoform X2 [Solea senegalensis]XP_043897932.1 proline-rich protein 7 isoform X2 [Solea senegalensis]XP_043897933.1 proline-rich protein 7 isoform X2 [Solea senegalensis]XP_043897934.1 proline-rich protein 7 isoform X2 [Solea senegalensis]KAG7516037.1 hypothetical protein JOB18_021140 [Solea senegalensis]KAG7516038.1 hypothetical protein JOB18_021140 [Solea senegalensis]KAG7516039.1 hypothetical pro